MRKFVVPLWTARVPDVRRSLHTASIAVAGDPDGRRGELRAIVEAESAEAAVATVRRAVGHDAAVPQAASPTTERGLPENRPLPGGGAQAAG